MLSRVAQLAPVARGPARLMMAVAAKRMYSAAAQKITTHYTMNPRDKVCVISSFALLVLFLCASKSCSVASSRVRLGAMANLIARVWCMIQCLLRVY